MAALFLCFYGLVAYALRGLSWHLKWSGVLADAALGRGVVTFMWRDVLPEIEPLWNEVNFFTFRVLIAHVLSGSQMVVALTLLH